MKAIILEINETQTKEKKMKYAQTLTRGFLNPILSLAIAFFAVCLLQTQVLALVMVTDKEIALKNSSGELSGYMIVNGRVMRNLKILGNYKVLKNKKSIVFAVTHIKKNQNYHTLSNQPTTIKEIKGAKKIKKGTKLILAGESESEISQILGMSKDQYRDTKNGESGGGGSSSSGGGGSYGSGSSSGGGYSSNGGYGSSGGVDGSSGGVDGSGGGNGNGGYYPPDSGSSSGGSSGGGSSNNPFPDIPDGGGNTSGGNGGYYPPSIGGGESSSGGTTILPSGGSSSGGSSGGSGGSSSNGSGGSNSENRYSSQFCKSPQRNGNEMSLSVVDRDGNCIDIKANRDDTKCQYRYDFNNGVAIKQTQFYYIDKENITQNIGGCVDLEGDEFKYPLYTDDSKCKLQSTEDKGYGGGSSHTFQTQILFRGADGLIHVAKDCSDFANVKEELIQYELDYQNRKLIRIVNQYYIDPTTGQKVYISNGIQSPYKSEWKEYTCGRWEYNDPALEAYRPTQIRAFDTVDSSYYNITGCDYSTDQGKSGKITQKYTKVFIDVNNKGEESGDLNLTQEFSINEAFLNTGTYRIREKCCDTGAMNTFCEYFNRDITTYSQTKKKSKWKVQYKTTNKGTTEKYVRPRQEKDTDEQYAQYQFYYLNKADKIIERIPLWTEVNEFGLDEEYMKYYEITELSKQLNLNDETLIQLNTEKYKLWKQTNYRETPRTKCLNYSISSGFWKPTGTGFRNYCNGTNVNNSINSCTESVKTNYIVPQIKKAIRK